MVGQKFDLLTSTYFYFLSREINITHQFQRGHNAWHILSAICNIKGMHARMEGV